jgi:hypothetical protein
MVLRRPDPWFASEPNALDELSRARPGLKFAILGANRRATGL